MHNYAAVVCLCSVRDVPKAVWNLFIKEFTTTEKQQQVDISHTQFFQDQVVLRYTLLILKVGKVSDNGFEIP